MTKASTAQQVKDALIPGRATHIRMNGCGPCLQGGIRDPGIIGWGIRIHWITALWLPILPLGVYVCRTNEKGQNEFAGRIRFKDFHRIYGKQALRAYLSAFLEGGAWIIAMILTFVLVSYLGSLLISDPDPY